MKILSFGEIIWDVYSPVERTLGGAPLNFAAYAAMQGAESYIYSAVGSDALGTEALESIKALDVHCDFVSVINGTPSGQCLVTLNEKGIPQYNVLENVAYDRIAYSPLTVPFDAICFGTLALRNEHNRKTVEELLDKNSFAEVFTDLNIRPPFFSAESVRFCLERSSIVKVSDEELPTVANLLFGSYTDADTASKAILAAFKNIRLLILTCGAEGAYCYDIASATPCFVPAVKTSVVSSVGAGDSFGATFLVQYFKTKSIPLALDVAAKVSAFVVSKKETVSEAINNFVKDITK